MAPLKLPGFSTSGVLTTKRGLQLEPKCGLPDSHQPSLLRTDCQWQAGGLRLSYWQPHRQGSSGVDRNRPTGAGHCHPAAVRPGTVYPFSAARILQDPENPAQQRSPVFNASHMPSAAAGPLRRTVRTYQNTYVRWVCSGHNTKGTGCCSNGATVDESALLDALQSYFTAQLTASSFCARSLQANLYHAYQTQLQKEEPCKDLHQKIGRLRGLRQKYLDLFAGDLVSAEELHTNLQRLRNELEALEQQQAALFPACPAAWPDPRPKSNYSFPLCRLLSRWTGSATPS